MGDESEFWKCQAAPAATLMQEPNTQAICGDRDDLPMSSVSCCRPPKPTQCGKLFGIWLQCGLYIHQWYTYLQTKTHTWYDIYIYIICIYIYIPICGLRTLVVQFQVQIEEQIVEAAVQAMLMCEDMSTRWQSQVSERSQAQPIQESHCGTLWRSPYCTSNPT